MKAKIRLILILFALNFVLYSQTYNNDARLWLYIKLDKDISNKWNAHLLVQNRFNNNVSEFSQAYSDVGVTYKLNKHVRIMADYVYGGQRRLNGTYTRIHQAYTGITLRQKLLRFSFNYRMLVQAQITNFYSSEKGHVPKIFWRNKLTVKYEINKRWDCFVAQELNSPFYRLNEIYFNRSRSFAGINYNINKASGFEFYFMLQQQLKYTGQPNRDFVYGITYSHSF